jgi:hypothetical protein
MTLPGFTAEVPLQKAATKFKAHRTPGERRDSFAQSSEQHFGNSDVTPALWRRPPYWGGCRCARYLNGHCDLWIC